MTKRMLKMWSPVTAILVKVICQIKSKKTKTQHMLPPSWLGLKNTLSVSLQRNKTSPKTLNNLIVKLQ